MAIGRILGRHFALCYFLGRAAWDTGKVQEALFNYAKENFLSPGEGGVIVVDETGFLKKGTHSAGVKPQYSGTSGRIENSQTGVFLALADTRGRALIDCELYLPHEWITDSGRRKKAHIPENVLFQTKPQLAQKMLLRVFSQGLKPDWVLGNAIYGSGEFYEFLEKQ